MPACSRRETRHSLRSACSRGPLRPLRGSAFGLGQPDDFVAGASPHGSRTPARGGYARRPRIAARVARRKEVVFTSCFSCFPLHALHVLHGYYLPSTRSIRLRPPPKQNPRRFCRGLRFCSSLDLAYQSSRTALKNLSPSALGCHSSVLLSVCLPWIVGVTL